VTPADFIRGRYGSRGLGLAIAFTGILATMPYVALQLVGMQAVLTVMGGSSSSTFVKDLLLLIATPASYWAYATLAVGSALALFMYPHAVTGVLASRSRNVISAT